MDKTNIKEMVSKARAAMANAYNPYSHFAVGACILADDDNLYVGCNAENASYRLTICAEQAAVGNMISAGGKQIIEVVIVTDSEKQISPCGACRQQLLEFAKPNTKIHMFNKQDQQRTMTMQELLPASFDTTSLPNKES
jgi:cytidine deaminase